MIASRDNFSVDENIGVDRLHGLAPFHQVEELVAVEDIDSRLLACVPALEIELEASVLRHGQGFTEQVIENRLQGSSFFGSFFLKLPEKPVVNRQRGSSHAPKCIVHASRCQSPELRKKDDLHPGRSSGLGIEPLEERIAPGTLIIDPPGWSASR
jgi:hypothetical protein